MSTDDKIKTNIQNLTLNSSFDALSKSHDPDTSGIFIDIFSAGIDKFNSISDVHTCRVPKNEEKCFNSQSLSSYNTEVALLFGLSGLCFERGLLCCTNHRKRVVH